MSTQPSTESLSQAADETAPEAWPAALVILAVTGLAAAMFAAGFLFGSTEPKSRVADEGGAVALATPAQPHGDARHGTELFGMTCIACHGPAGAGIPHLGANLRESKFVASQTDAQLVAFIKKGRQPGEPGSVLGLMMPPKGGNPALDDAGLRDIVAFIRTLQLDAKHILAGL